MFSSLVHLLSLLSRDSHKVHLPVITISLSGHYLQIVHSGWPPQLSSSWLVRQLHFTWCVSYNSIFVLYCIIKRIKSKFLSVTILLKGLIMVHFSDLLNPCHHLDFYEDRCICVYFTIITNIVGQRQNSKRFKVLIRGVSKIW